MVSTPSCRGESSVEPWFDRNTARLSFKVPSRLFGGPSGPGFVPPPICENIIRVGNRAVFGRTIAPAKVKTAFMDGRFDAFAFHLIEGLGVREVDVVGTTLEAKDLAEDFEVRLSELNNIVV